jgi:hypothetical protein
VNDVEKVVDVVDKSGAAFKTTPDGRLTPMCRQG